MSTKLQAASSSVCLNWSQGPLQLRSGPLPCSVSILPPSPLPQFPGPSGLLLFFQLCPSSLPRPSVLGAARSASFFFSVLPEPMPPACLVSVFLLPSLSRSLSYLFVSSSIPCMLLSQVPGLHSRLALHCFKAEANIPPWDVKGTINLSQPPFKTLLLETQAMSSYPDFWLAGSWPFAWVAPFGAHQSFFSS